MASNDGGGDTHEDSDHGGMGEGGTATVQPGDVFVAIDGDDGNDGTIDAPFATVQRALDAIAPGDTIHVRGGTYAFDSAVVLDERGTEDKPYRLVAHADEVPVFDFSSNPRHADPPKPRENDSIAATRDACGIFIAPAAAWWHVVGITVQNAPYYGVRVYGSNNRFERLVLHDNGASGLEITGKEGANPSHNVVLDSDSFHNFDVQGNGEDADGFAAKFDGLGPGNVFRGLRAWSNADDGYDFWHASVVVVDRCWSFDNGFNRPEWASQLSGSWQGDGMGFKLGQQAAELTLTHVAAWGNKAFGIDENGNGSAGGVIIYNATLINNTKSGNPVQVSLDDGRPHTIRNSVAFDTDVGTVTALDNAVDHTFNSWNGATVTPADFVSLDMDDLYADAIAPRGPDGSLPTIGLHLDMQSALIDAGTDVGLPFEGTAPDLGAFESTP